tara:strand:+ start:819 stop:1733 length:915 start_codon:yes stop_codon:yes gene_type:complete
MLKFSGVTKKFDRGKPPALQDVSFEVEPGKICGLLGHNGAGKSTALGVILGMVHPDSGLVSIGGRSVLTEREKAILKVGAIFESPAFYEYLSGWKNLKILSSYSGGVTRKLMEETVEWVGLKDRIHDRVGAYSHGMRQRLALAQALLPRPEVLILDEPTDGLDPEGIIEFRGQLLELREQLGLTVLLSSHLLAEVEQVCDEVVILQQGIKVYEGRVREMEDGRLVYSIDSDNPEVTGKICEKLGGRSEEVGYSFPAELTASKLLSDLLREGAAVSHFSAEKNSLEDLYLRFSHAAGDGEKEVIR